MSRYWREWASGLPSWRWGWYALPVPFRIRGQNLDCLVRTWSGVGDLLEAPAEALLVACLEERCRRWLFVLGPLSEEFGWRGYAQDRLGARFSPLAGSLFLGGVWALWHLPLFFIPGTSQAAAGQPLLQFTLFAVQVISQTVIITWLYNRSGRSLAAAILLHTLINLVGTVMANLLQPSLVDAAVQAAGYLAAATVLVLTTGRNLGAGAVTGKSATAA